MQHVHHGPRKNLPLAKDVIGSAKVEIMKSDQSPKIMSVTWAFEKPEDILILDRFAEKYILPYRKKISSQNHDIYRCSRCKN